MESKAGWRAKRNMVIRPEIQEAIKINSPIVDGRKQNDSERSFGKLKFLEKCWET